MPVGSFCEKKNTLPPVGVILASLWSPTELVGVGGRRRQPFPSKPEIRNSSLRIRLLFGDKCDAEWLPFCFFLDSVGLRIRNESEWNDRQIVEELLKRYRFPDPSANISVGVFVRLERLLDSSEDLLSIRQKWMESKLNYEYLRHSEVPVRLRSLDYIWSPALVIENALSVLNVGKNIINVFANGIVEFEQRFWFPLKVLFGRFLLNREIVLFCFRMVCFLFSAILMLDDGRAVWNRLLAVETAENLLLRPMEWRLIGSKAPDSKSVLLILRRSINRWIGTLFLPSLGLIVVGWFGSWFFKSDDRRRLQIQISASLGILFLVFLTQQYVPKTAFLKAIDFWCLSVSGVALLNLLLVIGTTASVSHTDRRRQSRTPYEPDSDKARWIVADTPTMPAILSRAVLPALRRWEVCIVRLSSTSTKATKQLTVDEVGHFRYERDRSRDSKEKNPQKPGDTPMRFLVRRLGHAYEIYPLIFLVGCLGVLLVFITYYSFEKIEVWLDRSQETPPWDWERVRHKYWKLPTLAFDTAGVTHQRLEIMEKLQDEMVEAAKKRGTR